MPVLIQAVFHPREKLSLAQLPYDTGMYPNGSLYTLRTRINDPCARALELLPLLVRSGAFFCLPGGVGVFFAPFREEEISDYHSLPSRIQWIIRVLTV